ncbi:MAG: 4Fe-4S binding protein [Candidatus Krumholzibacteriia bacterium]
MALTSVYLAPSMTVGLRAAPAGAFLLTAGLLALAETRTDLALLMSERLAPGTGWLQVLALAAYAAWLARAMLDPRRQPRLRRRIWLAFSIVFFAQFALGLVGLAGAFGLDVLGVFLMTGELHVPVPAVIIGGPLFRGGGLFMPILFAATLLLVGPAWCSHLCYFGAFDAQAAARRRRPVQLPRWVTPLRMGLLLAVPAAALALRAAGVPGLTAALVGAGFGVAGITVMLLVSRRLGTMAHCIVWCPLGLVSDLLGRISPFRVRIGSDCDDCQACTRACRFSALHRADIARRQPGLSCTLCGDCVQACPKVQLGYRFPGLSPARARALFVTVVVALHAVFLGVARI